MVAKTYIVILAAVVVIGCAAGAFVLMSDDGDKDTYYVYLDGFDDKDGWYTGHADDPVSGVKNALKGKVSYNIGKDGWIGDINGKSSDYNSNIGIGVFCYISTDISNPNMKYFFAGPVLSDVTGNIIYIVYSSYTLDSNFAATYDKNPESSKDSIISGGPFTDENYKPIALGKTYDVYLDGFGDNSGWYKGNGSNPFEGFKDALTKGSIEFDITDSGWVKSIDGRSSSWNSETSSGTGFGFFLYASSDRETPWAGYFTQGPVVSQVASNILYVTFSDYTMDMSDYSTDYVVNPLTTSDKTLMSTGPFESDLS